MKIKELIEITGAKVFGNFNPEQEVEISTDTRTIKKGDFYLPLKGSSFDGENFISQAFEKGAIGTFCTKPYSEKTLQTYLQVQNTLEAYLKLANHRRNKLNLKVVAITGSSGKTTTKEIVAATLETKYKTFKTPLNHNNEIGFCQTIFETPNETEVLVIEMGMRGLGEIELLSKYAEPDITIISNVGTAHIGRLGSKENIAKAKCEIVKYQRGNLFIGHNNDLIKKNLEFDGRKIFYSINDANIIEKSSSYSKFEYNSKIYNLNVGGDFNIENALAAINCAENLGLNYEEISSGLANYKPIEKRWESISANGYEIINDSYNANPESMRAFVDTVFELYNNFVIVLGDMGELGENEINYHKELGTYINNHKNFSSSAHVITIGNLSKNISDNITNCEKIHFQTIEESAEYINNSIQKDCKIFLKASRSMKFEQIIKLLQK